MNIISHRGLWTTEAEKNTEIAFRRSFSAGFGTETDIRDYCGELVISHDIAHAGCMLFSEFLEIYSQYSQHLPLALNIKADGLQNKLSIELNKYRITNYFVFDMSVPDGIGYIKVGLRTFTRQSEFEINPAYYEYAKGVWIDEFEDHWVTEDIINGHLVAGKEVCLVSPELHSRSKSAIWKHYKEISRNLQGTANLMICTDSPEDAQRMFNED